MTLTLGDASEIPRNGRKFYTVNGESIAVLDVEGALYAIRNSCPHTGGPVGAGKVFTTRPKSEHPVSRFADFSPGREPRRQPTSPAAESASPTISCPLHGWTFDLADGTPTFPANRGVRTYPVWVEDGLIRLESGSEETAPDREARTGSVPPAVRSP